MIHTDLVDRVMADIVVRVDQKIGQLRGTLQDSQKFDLLLHVFMHEPVAELPRFKPFGSAG